jgi:predicted nucleic acid-binding protein
MNVYFDTSALAKRYLEEPFSEEVDAYLGALDAVTISRLALVEFRCLLARRRRNGELADRDLARCWGDFQEDLGLGLFVVRPMDDAQALHALELIAETPSMALRTLDALHLAAALEGEVSGFATADRTQAQAARKLGLKVRTFF